MAVPSKRQMQENLQKRQQKEQTFYRRTGSLFVSNVSLKYYKTPMDANLIDIIPYIAGENDPIGPGEVAHKLVIYIHPKLSQTGEDIICMEKTFKGARGKCPACQEYRRRVAAMMSEEEIKPFKVAGWPRVLYNVYDRKNPNSGVQVWNASSYLFQQYLDVIARRSSTSPGQQPENYVNFMDPTLEGRSIGFDKQGKNELTKYIGIHFEERQTEVPDSILEAAHVLDEIIAWPTYASAYEETWGVPYDDNDVPEGIASERTKKYDKEVKKVEEKSKPVEEKKEQVETDEEREERELEEKVAAVRKKKEAEKAGAKSTKEKAQEKKTSSSGCPHGHVFGIDIDEKPDCDKCQSWKECAKEADRLEREKR